MRHRARPDVDRQELGEYWRAADRVFTSTSGTDLEPRNLRRTFGALIAKADVRRIRSHDLRHVRRALLIAQGMSMRVSWRFLGTRKSE